MERLIAIQHCQSEHHINKLSGGWTDTPLTDFGRKQAARIGERLKGELEAPMSIYASDLLRASQTADIIGDHIGIKPEYNMALREHSLGSGTGKTKEWVHENIIPFPDKDRIDHRLLPDAETLREHYTRVVEFMESLDKKGVPEAIMVVHGGTLTKIIMWWMKIPVETMEYSYFQGRPGGITYLGADKRSDVRVLNVFSDCNHLAGLSGLKCPLQ